MLKLLPIEDGTEYFADPAGSNAQPDWTQRPTQNPVEVGPP